MSVWFGTIDEARRAEEERRARALARRPFEEDSMEIARRAAEAGAAGGPVDYDAIADRVFRTPEKAPVPVFDLLNASHIDAADRAHSEQLNLKRKLEVEAKRAENERERRARRAAAPPAPVESPLREQSRRRRRPDADDE